MDLKKITIYRLTHINNVSHIIKHGITHKKSLQANENFITIGDLSLIKNRSTRLITIDNGTDDNIKNCKTVIIGDLIPFYFGTKMPMLYVVQNGGNFVEKPTSAEDIVYVACSLSKIIDSNAVFYFSDGHATDGLTTFYDKTHIQNLPKIVDWKAVTAPYWGGQENLDLKRKKQSEFLVQHDLSPATIIGFGCFNDFAKNKLIGFNVDIDKIKIIPKAYF